MAEDRKDSNVTPLSREEAVAIIRDLKAQDKILWESSDIAAILVGAAQVERRIREVIRKSMPNDPIEGEDRLLGTDDEFSGSPAASRTRLAYRLNLIDRQLYESVAAIHRLRNYFAHHRNPELSDAVPKKHIENIVAPHGSLVEFFRSIQNGTRPLTSSAGIAYSPESAALRYYLVRLDSVFEKQMHNVGQLVSTFTMSWAHDPDYASTDVPSELVKDDEEPK